MKIIKRDGRKVDFDKDKIIQAINKANDSIKPTKEKLSKTIIKSIADDISKKCSENNKPKTVEEIQDMVEEHLIQHGAYRVAKEYITYRYKRNLVRQSNTTDKSIHELLNGESDYWNNENSNKNARVVTTQRDYLAGITSTDIAKRFLLPKDVLEAHEEGIIHQHDMDYMSQFALHNCFHRDTKFVTNTGVRSFNDCYDGEPVVVRDMYGEWREATVHKYNKQPMFDVTLKAGRTTKTVTCTMNHRWILSDETVTTNLNIGDSLKALPDSSEYTPQTLEEKKYWCFGFVLGDGIDVYNKDAMCGHRVHLFGDKQKYLDNFTSVGYQLSFTSDGTPVVFHKKGWNKAEFLCSNAWKYLSCQNKIALFNGLYAADGSTIAHRISTSDNNMEKLIEELSAVAGYYITKKDEIIHDTNYLKDARLVTYSFMVSQNRNRLWKVLDIKPHNNKCYPRYGNKTGNPYPRNNPIVCWCVEEPVTHSFTLADGIVTGNCDLINLNDMLQNGTVINDVKIDPQHKLLTAATVATQIITAVASSQYGGCTITLSHLAPFVRMSYEHHYKDGIAFYDGDEDKAQEYANVMLKREIRDAVQTFNYQINSMSTTNGQAPFLSVCMYISEDKEYEHETALLIEEFLSQRILGMKNKVGIYVTPAFPKLLYVLDENNIEEGQPYYYLTELAAKCTAKRMVPDYISAKVMKQLKINKDGKGDIFPCMGCRSFLTPDTCTENYAKALDYDPNKGKYYGRFNMGVTTINLVDAALSSNGDFEKFWDLMEERTELCHKGLLVRINRLEQITSDVAPILWQDGALARLDKGEKITNLIHNNYSTASLGYAGLYECVKYMTGKSHSDGAEGEKFGLEVMKFLNDKCNEWKAAENIGYSVYGSPIESTTYKFAKCLKKRFGVIEGITDRNYITNSYHIPVFEKINAFEKLAKESKFQNLSPGGAISYIECANLTGNIEAVLAVIHFIYENIMYAELNTKSDYCQVCGYDGEMRITDDMNWECPNCGNHDKNKLNVSRRTCGYIGSHFWNYGRTQEIKERYVHLGDNM